MFKPIIISIQGNIGVGKSTLLDILKLQFPNSAFVGEPVDLWCNLKDNTTNTNILDAFYQDKTRWSYTFQNMAYITRMMTLLDHLNKPYDYIFMDRSMDTDKNVFGKMLYDQGHMTTLEWNIYNIWNEYYEKYVNSNDKKNIIYLSVPQKLPWKE